MFCTSAEFVAQFSLNDVGSGELYVTVSAERDPQPVRSFCDSNGEAMGQTAQFPSMRSGEKFMPASKEVRQWNDRKMKIDKPLFPGWVFVQLHLQSQINETYSVRSRKSAR
jgi:transcription antitermination factor NusG